jgi:hypothetical protein
MLLSVGGGVGILLFLATAPGHVAIFSSSIGTMLLLVGGDVGMACIFVFSIGTMLWLVRGDVGIAHFCSFTPSGRCFVKREQMSASVCFVRTCASSTAVDWLLFRFSAIFAISVIAPWAVLCNSHRCYRC